MSNTIKFILNKSVFQFPCSRKLLVKIPESKEDLFNELFINHKYQVQSKVRNEIFQHFLNYWKEDTFPQIDSSNIIEYYQLSAEFGLLDDYFTSQKLKEPLFNLNFFINSSQNSKSIKPTIERNIALNLDEYLTNFSDKLILIDINSLYNIFYHPERKLDDHDKAYKFIVENAGDQNKNIFILIGSLDLKKLKVKENRFDALNRINEHSGFCPQNIFLVTDEYEKKNVDLENQLNSSQEQNGKLENQLKSLKEQNGKLENQLKSSQEKLKFIKKFETKTFVYTGFIQQADLPAGTYKLEVWGAQGGNRSSNQGGRGGYSVGNITLKDDTSLFIYVGGKGDDAYFGKSGGWNGGGDFNNNNFGIGEYSSGGGGATDISLRGTKGSKDWNNTNHLYSRIIVAGGGSGASYGGGSNVNGGFGGGEVGGGTLPGSQTAAGKNGSFGVGANEGGDGWSPDGAAGGGWYGGGSYGLSKYSKPSGGGSGYVYTSSTQSNYPSGCLLNSSFYLSNASTKGGDTSFPSVDGNGNETGHAGNGAAKITLLSL